jgi:hypothetical protein
MNSGATVGGALGAAALFAVGTALQYRAVQMRPRSATASGGEVYGAVRLTLTSFTWLLGTVILLAGVSLHAFAPHEGPLTLVQPLLVTGCYSLCWLADSWAVPRSAGLTCAGRRYWSWRWRCF